MTSERRGPIRELGENRLIALFRSLASAGERRGVVVGPGDDTAVLRLEEARLGLFTCDMMVEGVHFRREWSSGEDVGWKAMAQNVSDIAAMGGEPGFAVASVAAAGDLEAALLEGIAAGLVECASDHGAALVGGDLVGSTGPTVVDVALIGWVEENTVLRRCGARPGDAVLVTGQLGASAAGLAVLKSGLKPAGCPEVERAVAAHRRPRPRLAEGRAIARTRRATAMMDLSDGLAEDLQRLCGESEVGARIEARRIPIDADCRAVAERLGQDALMLATSGGEDYELLFTCLPDAVDEIEASVSRSTGTGVTVIGEVATGGAAVLLEADGRESAFRAGFDHFR
jgi:thiamine-monophosphate kinase